MLLEDMLRYNYEFVNEEKFKDYETDKFPNKNAVIFTCMDTRLVELLPKALNLKNGDVKMVKNAGAILDNPYDSVMRSLLVAVYELQADEVFVIGHHGCGMKGFNSEGITGRMQVQGVTADDFEQVKESNVDLNQWLKGFNSVEESVKKSVETIRNHPLLPEDTPVHGLVIDPATGKLDLIENGY